MNKSDLTKDAYMLTGPLNKQGYDWWWHSFTGCHRKTGAEKSFFIEYFIINPGQGENKPVLGRLKENQIKGIEPSYVMVKAGCWGKDALQLNHFYSVKEMRIKPCPILFQAGDCQLSEKKISGIIHVNKEESKNPAYMSDSGTMEWNLEVNKQIAFNAGYGTSTLFRSLNAFEMYWHAEGMKTEYKGTVTLNGEIYDVIPEKSYGYADKNWGKNFTNPWIWIGCSHMVRVGTGEVLEHSALDIGGGCPKIFGIPLKEKLLMNFYYEGKELEYNFSKFWQMSQTVCRIEETEEQLIWRVWAEDRKTLIKIKLACSKSEMLKIDYEAPDGRGQHNCLWNGGTGTGELIIYSKKGGRKRLVDRLYLKNSGCEYGRY